MEDEQRDIYGEAIETYGKQNQIIVCIEEMAELQKCLTKALRANESKLDIAEEIADVEIMLEQMKRIFCCRGVVERWTEMKLERLGDRIEIHNDLLRQEVRARDEKN